LHANAERKFVPDIGTFQAIIANENGNQRGHSSCPKIQFHLTLRYDYSASRWKARRGYCGNDVDQ